MTSSLRIYKAHIPPGYQPIDATNDNATRHSHGGLEFVLRVSKKPLDVSVSTFDYLCGYVSTRPVAAERGGGGRREHPPRAAQGRDLEGQNMEFSNLAPSDLV